MCPLILSLACAATARALSAAKPLPHCVRPGVERESPRALAAAERQAMVAALHSERFVDQAAAEVYAALFD